MQGFEGFLLKKWSKKGGRFLDSLTFCVFISVVEWHKTKFRIKTKKQKYKLNIKLNQKPQLNKHVVIGWTDY